MWLEDCAGGSAFDAATLDRLGDLSEVPVRLNLPGEPLVVNNGVWVAPFDPGRTSMTELAALDLESFEVIDEFDLSTRAPGLYAFDSVWFAIPGELLRIPAAALSRVEWRTS